MNKAYERINWKNYPSEETALNESNLNRMDAALNEVDTRVVAHETTKLDVATANTMVRNISFNERTGIFTVTYLNGSTKELDTKLEKIATNFEYDAERQKLILTLVDGSVQEIDMSDLITEYEFENSAYINWTVVNGKVKAEIIDGSITADKLQPDFLADVTLQAGNAEISARAANQYAQKAKEYADEAKGSAELANTDGIVDIMNQATTTWVMPDYMKNRDKQPYVCGIGTPEENGYSADDYNDENGYDEPYLDVRSGMVYHAIRVKDLPLTYGWVEKEQLAGVQKKVEQNAEDISNIKNTLANVDVGTATAENGVINQSCVVFKYGRMCIFTGVARTGSEGVPTSTVLLKLPYKPTREVYGLMGFAGQMSAVNIRITTNGEVVATNNSVAANSYMIFNMSYITTA